MTPQEIFNKVNEGEIELADLLPSDRIKLIEYKLSIGSLYSGEYPWLLARVRQLEDTLILYITKCGHMSECKCWFCQSINTNPCEKE